MQKPLLDAGGATGAQRIVHCRAGGELLFQPAHELVHALQALFDVGQARGVADAHAVVRSEGDAWHSGDFLLLQEPGAELGGFQPRARDVREEVESALGVDTGDAGETVRLLPRMLRGGNWITSARYCRSVFRVSRTPDSR